MVVGPKISIQHVPSKGKISMMMIQNFTVQKRQSVIRVSYGALLVIISTVMASINPIELFTNWLLEMREGSFIYHMWEKPPYELYTEVWIFNYTNTPEYLRGDDTKLKLQEVGPFTFREIRTNENVKVDKDQGLMFLNPKIALEYIREQSVADLNDVSVNVPNIALLAIGTLLADRLPFFVNVIANRYITGQKTTLFRNMTVNDLFWGYDDPLVTLANRFLPGWIDFARIGVLDRFYAPRQDQVAVELKDYNKRYSIMTWNGSPGLAEQGYKDFNTSSLCNRIQGAYEGVMISPNYPKGRDIPIFRRQACGIYPFSYEAEMMEEYGFTYYRYGMAKTAFSRTSPYACNCSEKCLPEGFVDVSSCYYGFPIALSKPHFLDADPVQLSYFEGMNPDPVKDASFINLEPTIGVPLALKSNIQVNIAVRTSSGNPITNPLKNKVVPLLWLSIYCKNPPSDILSLLHLRFIVAPPLVITFEVLLFIIGMVLGIQGFYRIWKPKYKLVKSKEMPIMRKQSVERRKTSVVSNRADGHLFKDDLAKEAVSLLGTHEDDSESDMFVRKLTLIRKKSAERRKSSVTSTINELFFKDNDLSIEAGEPLAHGVFVPNTTALRKRSVERKPSVVLNMADNQIFSDDNVILFPSLQSRDVPDSVFKNPIPIRKRSAERKLSNVIFNIPDKTFFKDDKNMDKEALSLLVIDENESDISDIMVSD